MTVQFFVLSARRSYSKRSVAGTSLEKAIHRLAESSYRLTTKCFPFFRSLQFHLPTAIRLLLNLRSESLRER